MTSKLPETKVIFALVKRFSILVYYFSCLICFVVNIIVLLLLIKKKERCWKCKFLVCQPRTKVLSTFAVPCFHYVNIFRANHEKSSNTKAGVRLNVVFPPLNMGLIEISHSRFKTHYSHYTIL